MIHTHTHSWVLQSYIDAIDKTIEYLNGIRKTHKIYYWTKFNNGLGTRDWWNFYSDAGEEDRQKAFNKGYLKEYQPLFMEENRQDFAVFRLYEENNHELNKLFHMNKKQGDKPQGSTLRYQVISKTQLDQLKGNPNPIPQPDIQLFREQQNLMVVLDAVGYPYTAEDMSVRSFPMQFGMPKQGAMDINIICTHYIQENNGIGNDLILPIPTNKVSNGY